MMKTLKPVPRTVVIQGVEMDSVSDDTSPMKDTEPAE
jgi:hypothetical protein